MAAGRTNRRWTAREVLTCPLHWFPLKSDDRQVQCHVMEWLGKVQAEEVGCGFTSG